MATAELETPTLQDLVDRLGGIPLSRVLARPAPGSATEADVLEIQRRQNRLCELVEGVLVEKPMGFRESLLALALAGMLRDFVKPRKLGLVSGPDGMMRLFPGMVRIPDVAFISWTRVPHGRVPQEPIPDLVPDLAIEILSQTNTTAEMDRKRREYFQAGVEIVWLIDPEARSLTSYESSAETGAVFHQTEPVRPAKVLPGFELDLADLFAELDQTR